MTTLHGADMRYPVCDLFASIQGEATWTGCAMLFVRFSGCPLACPWCDEPRHKDPEATRLLTGAEIVAAMRQLDPTLSRILLTGGEPLAVKGLAHLVACLKEQGYWLAMETCGIGGEIPSGLDWITLSPKTPLPEAVFAQAHEIKYIVASSPTDRQTKEIQARARMQENVWVQPRAEGEDEPTGPTTNPPQALQHCLTHIKQSAGRIRLSLQTHKWIGLP